MIMGAEKPMSEANANPLEPFIDAIADAVVRKLATRNGEAAGNRPDKPLAPYLTVAEAADAEAADVSRLSVPTVRSLIRRGKLKGHRVGRRVVVQRLGLERFLDAN